MKKFHEVEWSGFIGRMNPVFSRLQQSEVIKQNASRNYIAFKKGQEIFSEGSNPYGLYCVMQGKIKIVQTGDNGREQIVRFARSGDIMGYRALLTGDKYSCSGIALEETDVCFIPKDVFMNLLQTDNTLAFELLRLLGNDLRNAEHRITDLAQKPVRERIAEAILFLKETYGVEADGQTINVKLSREELANVVGTATETAIRLLSEFKSEGMLELPGKKIKILDEPQLMKTANIHEVKPLN